VVCSSLVLRTAVEVMCDNEETLCACTPSLMGRWEGSSEQELARCWQRGDCLLEDASEPGEGGSSISHNNILMGIAAMFSQSVLMPTWLLLVFVPPTFCSAAAAAANMQARRAAGQSTQWR
jgi:hypothetical protein